MQGSASEGKVRQTPRNPTVTGAFRSEQRRSCSRWIRSFGDAKRPGVRVRRVSKTAVLCMSPLIVSGQLPRAVEEKCSR